MRNKLITPLSIYLAIIILFDLAQSYSTEGKQEQITCTGIVVDEQERPVAGAKVGLYKLVISMELMSFDTQLTQWTTTKDNGTFTFKTTVEENQMNNQTILLVDKEGLALGWANWYLIKDFDVRITLSRPARLAGRVMDESGDPISDAEVSISVMLMTGGSEPRYIAGQISEQLFKRKTDTEGKFRFDRIPVDGAAEFIVKKSGLATVGTLDEANAQKMQLQFKAGQEDIEIKLPVEAKIEGTVVETETGQPIPGVKLMVFQGNLQPFSGHEPVTSQEDGTFTLSGLSKGKLIVRAVPPKQGPAAWVAQPVEVDVEAGRTVSGVKVNVSKGGLAEITVTELNDNTPVDSAVVTIQNTVSNEQFNLQTNNNGMIQKRLAPGEYQFIRVYKQDYPFERREETFTVENGKTSRITIQLKGHPKVIGTVRDEAGRPIAGAEIMACPFPLNRGKVTSDSEGRFEVRRLTPQRASDVVPYVIARHFDRNLAAAVEIEEEFKNIDIKMTDGVTCTGKVVDGDNKPIENARVHLTFWSLDYGTSLPEQENTTNAEGNYEIKAVPRHYQYSVNASAEGYGQDYVRISTEDVEDNRCKVDTIALAPANLSISGIVVDMEGNPVDNAQISCQGRGQPYRNTKTDQNGRFTLESVCAGKIGINANKNVGTYMYGRIDTEGGATDIRIVIGQNPSLVRSEQKRPPSLVGQSLANLKTLGVDLSQDDIEGKRLLVCFWDMQQRPSRHCLMQLVKQAETLNDKDVIVVAVQASKEDQNALNEWVKKYNVPFFVGMVQGEVEKTCFVWGVQSLPWLILTDNDHVVVSQGFSLRDLDNQLGQGSP